MKRDKIKVLIIYVLIFVIIALVGYLIYFVFSQNEPEKEKPKENTNVQESNIPEVSSSCTFKTTANEFNSLATSASSLTPCNGMNKYIVNDIMLNGKKQKVEIIYFNSEENDKNSKTGIYLNDEKIIALASTNYKNTLAMDSDKLFITSINTEDVNILVYNSTGNKLYSLQDNLTKTKISDPAFAEIARTNESLNPIVDTKHIDGNSIVIVDGAFQFDTDSKLGCTEGQMYNGSTYKVTFAGTIFSNPEFVSYKNCS